MRFPRTFWVFLGALVALELFSFGLQIHQMGFYHDDWVFLGVLQNASPQSFLETLRAYSVTNNWSRPGLMLYIPTLYFLGGTNPLPYHIAILIFETLTGLFLFLAFRDLSKDDWASFLAAAAFLLYPNRASTHFWFVVSVSAVSTAFTSAAFLLHARGMRANRAAFTAAAAACYLLAIMMYEATVTWFVVIAAFEFWDLGEKGRRPWEAALHALKATAPYAGVVVLLILYQQVLLPWFAPGNPAKGISISFHHIAYTYWAGLRCLTSWALLHCWQALTESLHSFSAARWILLAAGTGCAGFFLLRTVRPEQPKTAAERLFLLTGAALFAAAYLPYAATGSYAPQISGLMNRLNTGGALAGGLVIAALWRWTERRFPRLRPALVGALLCAFILSTAANWRSSQQWSESWRLQRQVLHELGKNLDKVPAGGTLLVAGVPNNIGTAVVFDSSWDISYSIMVMTGRKNIQANIMSPRIRHDRNSVREESGGQLLKRYGYEKLWVYRHDQGRITPTRDEKSLIAALYGKEM